MPQVHPKIVLLSHTSNPEQVVAMAAKLCYSKSNLDDLLAKITEKDQKDFIKKLAEVGHESPLEHASFTFGIEGISRACSHQLVRHRLCSFSQQSQRYCSFENDASFDYVIPPTIDLNEGTFELAMEGLKNDYQDLCRSMRSKGVPEADIAQDARFILPNAAATRIIMTANARELRHIFNVRCCGRAQWEIRHVAWAMWKLCVQAAPSLFAGSGPNCVVTGKCPEGKRSCGTMEVMKQQYHCDGGSNA